MTTRYTGDEADRIGRVTYVAARSGIDCEAYDDLPDWRRKRWITAGLAAVAEAERINLERIARWRPAQRRSVRLHREKRRASRLWV